MVVDDYLKEVQSKFSQTEQGDVINRLIALINDEDEPCAEAFLIALASSVEDIVDSGELVRIFIDIAEQFICSGGEASPDSDLVRVVAAINFLCYYSRMYIKVEDETRRQRIIAKLQEIRAILVTVNEGNLHLFLDTVLNLNGRLRRRGYPLWLTTKMEVENCFVFADYVEKLALGNMQGPGFRFEIGLHHLGNTPNVPAGEPDHDPNQTMMVHHPTIVDGMYYETFTNGGVTIGGAKEYVSKLDNTDAIDRLEMIE